MPRRFDPLRHPRDSKGRFTKSRTVLASSKDKKAIKEIAAALKPAQVGDGRAYAAKIADPQQEKAAQGFAVDAQKINADVRAGHADAAGVKSMDDAMRALPEDLVLHRSVPTSAFGGIDPMSLQGMKVRDAGFSSTQLEPVGAGSGVRMYIAAPKGSRAVVNSETGEVYLDRDSEMVVSHVAANSAGGHDMYLTLLPKQGATTAPAKTAPDAKPESAPDKPSARVPTAQDVPELNTAIKAGKTPAEAAALDAALTLLDRDRQLTLRVPVDHFGTEDPTTLEGSTVTEAGYTVAAIGRIGGRLDSMRLHIDVPAGTPSMRDGNQFVLGRDLTMTVSSVEKLGSGRYDVYLTVKPAAEGKAADHKKIRPKTVPLTGDAALGAAPVSLAGLPNTSEGRKARKALNYYTGADYARVNNTLRDVTPPYGTDPKEVAHNISVLDETMAGSALTKDVVTYRGLTSARTMFGDRVDGDLTGVQWREDAYMSTTADDKTARTFATGDSSAVPMMMTITIPAGTPAVSIAGPESELLVGRGQNLRVVKDSGLDSRGYRQVEVEVVPGPAAGKKA